MQIIGDDIKVMRSVGEKNSLCEARICISSELAFKIIISSKTRQQVYVYRRKSGKRICIPAKQCLQPTEYAIHLTRLCNSSGKVMYAGARGYESKRS